MANPIQDRSTKLRPGEKVLQHLETVISTAGKGENKRLPTAKELSESLEVGISTVQKVYKRLITEGRLTAVPGSGTFVTMNDTTSRSTEKRIAVSFGSVDDIATDLWQSRIATAIIESAERSGSSHEIVPFHPGRGVVNQKLLREKFDQCEGVILFPHPALPTFLETARKTAKPWVSLHPVAPHSTANFVSPDYINGCLAIGKAYLASGRKRFALVQAHPAGKSSISNFLRIAGLLDEVGPHLGETVDVRIIDAPAATFQTGREIASKLFAKGGFRPDFVFCMGDFLAHGFLSWLHDHQISCPEEVSLIAGSGLRHNPDPFPGMTCMHQPLGDLGESLIQLLLRRIDTQIDLPGVYVPHDFIGGETTLLQENELLFKP